MARMQVLLSVVGVSIFCACAPLVGEGDIPCIRTGAATVEERSAEFGQPDEHPLLGIAPGVVLDDLGGLDGCWGAYYVGSDSLGNRTGVEFYRFDFQANEMVYQVVTRRQNPSLLALMVGHFDTAGEWVYSLAIDAQDRIVVELLSAHGCNNIPGDDPWELNRGSEGPTFVLQVTLQDDTFKFGDSEDASPDFSAPHRANLLFFRLDCPEDLQ